MKYFAKSVSRLKNYLSIMLLNYKQLALLVIVFLVIYFIFFRIYQDVN